MSQNSDRKSIKGEVKVGNSEQLASPLDSHHQVYPYELDNHLDPEQQ
jgi:hypothetical protein